MNSKDAKQRIILATIECIESEGFQNLTIRKIANKAGVNVAAINYHFGSKKQLLSIIMASTLQESFVNNLNDYAELWGNDTRTALKLFLSDTLSGAVQHPNITRAHFAEIFNQNNLDAPVLKQLTIFLENFLNLIKPVLKQQDDTSKVSVVQLFGIILLVGMMPEIFTEFLQLDLRQQENQKIFIEILLENFIG